MTAEGARLDECFRALSHPDRRRFLRACAGQWVSAGELAEHSQLALASVSEHLKVLRKTGLLAMKRDGRFRRFRANRALVRKLSIEVSSLAAEGKETHGT